VTTVPAVIVGAGPTGITAATLLAQYGVDCLVLDRWANVYPQPRAVHLDDEIYRLLARLGISDEFAAISRPAQGLRLLDPTMCVLAEFRRDTALSVHGFPQANMFDQPEFEALLRTNLKRYPNAELRGNVEVTEVEETSDGRMRVAFVDRTDNSEHDVYADFVLGCDGANSVVRARIGAAMRDMRFEQRWLVVDAATDADLDQWDGVHQVCDPARAGTYMRIGSTRYRWEFRLLPSESAADFRSPRTLKPLIAQWTSRVRDDELELVRVTEYTFKAQTADRWRRGNVFLLGDAAHLTPPFIGQGMGAGVRDAMNLAWKLAGVISGDLPRAALDSYEQERKPHTRHMIRLALKRRLGYDGRRGIGQSHPRPGRHAHEVRPGTGKQGRRQSHTGIAPVRVRSQTTRTPAAGRNVVPQPCSRRRPPTRQRPRRRLRADLRGNTRRHAAPSTQRARRRCPYRRP
jgi:3-(3-hydroxy-phenyl)propionate hydroxylase